MSIEKKIEAVCDQILDDLLSRNDSAEALTVKMEQRVIALKVVTNAYAIIRKLPPEKQESTLNGLESLAGLGRATAGPADSIPSPISASPDF